MSLRDREKACRIISSCIKLFNEFHTEDFEKIKRWAHYAKIDDAYFTPFSLTQSIYDCLWTIPEAVDEGFSKYLERRKREYNEMLSYHNKNCEGKCLICDDRQVIKNLLGIDYERKEP